MSAAIRMMYAGIFALFASCSSAASEVSISSRFTADQPTETTSVAEPAPPVVAPSLHANTAVEGESSEIVQGIVEAFFNKQKLQPGEAQCLSQGAGKLAGDAAATAANLFVLFEQALGKQLLRGSHRRAEIHEEEAKHISGVVGGTAAKGGSEAASAASSADLDVYFFRKRRLSMNSKLMRMTPAVVMQLGMAAEKMVTISHQVAQDCLQKDALAALKKSGEHIQSTQYISGRIVANGQDIVQELADAVVAYKAHDFRKCGTDFGKALRKVFLSKADGAGLPEGMPDEEVVANVTEGFLQGFFGEGSQLLIKMPSGTDHMAIPIDLHQCISNNLAFFQSIWAEVMFVYTKKMAGVKPKEQMQWSTAVAFTMMKLPKAMERCNMGPEEQQMLEDAIMGLASGHKALGWDFKLPGMRLSNDELEKHLAITVEAWAEQQWLAFGQDLGHLLREMVLTVFSQKYTLDGNGLLQKRLGQHMGALRTSVAAYLVVSCIGAVIVGFAVMRRIVATRSRGEMHSHVFTEFVSVE